jgi:predicted small metal-binding protein
LAEELNESSKKKCQSFRKCHEMHKLAETSINNLKEKLK